MPGPSPPFALITHSAAATSYLRWIRGKEAGAIVLGKENLEEFAAGATSKNLHYGAVHNPWALEHIPGGSSGGGGANVAAGVTFASLGADLGGSVRIPGTFCGVVGLKQTFGRVSQRGLMVTSFNGDHIGPLTRSVNPNPPMERMDGVRTAEGVRELQAR